MEIYFVGLSSPALAIERVRQRVKAGGHGVPEADIERRYYESIEHLHRVMPICDYIEIYDKNPYANLEPTKSSGVNTAFGE